MSSNLPKGLISLLNPIVAPIQKVPSSVILMNPNWWEAPMKGSVLSFLKAK
jgi:hypothetical protein